MRKLTPATTALFILATWLLWPLFNGIGLPSLVNVPGPRVVYILRESDQDSAAFSRMVNNLRDGAIAKELEAGKHQVEVLDDDNPAAAKWLPALQGVQMPAALVVAPPSKILAKQPLPADAKAETILALIKANGG